jgi:cell division protein FtsL
MSAAPATAPARRPERPRRRPSPKTAPQRPPARRGRGKLRAVRPAARRRRRTAPFALLSAVLLGSLVVGIVTLQALVSQTAFRMQDLQARTHQLQQDYGERKLKVARLSSPDRIAAAAGRAGLVLPDASHVATVHVGGGQGTSAHSSDTPAGSAVRKASPGAQP